MNEIAYPDDQLRALLAGVKTIAVVGASPKPQRPSHAILVYLAARGYRVFAVNPGHAGREIGGCPVYARLADIPEPVDLVDIFRRPEALSGVVDEALALVPLPSIIWMQLDLRDDAAAARAEAAGVKVVMDRCIKVEHGRLFGRA